MILELGLELATDEFSSDDDAAASSLDSGCKWTSERRDKQKRRALLQLPRLCIEIANRNGLSPARSKVRVERHYLGECPQRQNDCQRGQLL